MRSNDIPPRDVARSPAESEDYRVNTSDHPQSPSVSRLASLIASARLVRAQGSVSPLMSGAWSGNVTSTSATVCIRLVAPGQRVRLVASADEQLSSAIVSATATSNANAGNAVSLDIVGLQPNTTYYYGIEVAGNVRLEPTSRGRFRTFPQGAGQDRIGG